MNLESIHHRPVACGLSSRRTPDILWTSIIIISAGGKLPAWLVLVLRKACHLVQEVA